MRKPHLAHRPRRKHEEHANHEAWAIPYADLLTLLLAFFVVMYAISSVNAGKYRVLSDSLFAAFRGAPRTMEPIQVGEKQVGSGADIQTTIVQQAMIEGQPRSLLAVKADPGSSRETGNPAVTPKAGPQLSGMAAAASQALQKVADQVEQAMDDLVKDNLVVVRRSDFWIEVEIKADILFPSGSAHLGTNAGSVIERLAASLAPFPNPIRVEGYTDNLPIKNLQFYSNWELSAARAGSVVRVLSGHGVDPGRLAVIGYGEQRPIQSNDTAPGRNANRRVVIVILSTQLQRKQDGSDLPPATTASAAASGAGDGGNVPGPLSSDPAPSGAPPTVVPTQAGEVAMPATLAVPGEPATPPGRAVPGTRTTPTPIGQPALPGRPAPAPQAVPAVRGTGPSTTFNTGPRAPAMQHEMKRMA